MNISKIPTFILAMLALSSCIKDENFDVVPVIEFQSFVSFQNEFNATDSAIFIFSFQDGDGDIGSSDSTNFNCFLTYQEKNGAEITNFPNIEPRTYRLPSLTPNAKDKNIEGEISLTLKPAPIFNIATDSAYRYSCYITDRAGNESNTITSPWILK